MKTVTRATNIPFGIPHTFLISPDVGGVGHYSNGPGNDTNHPFTIEYSYRVYPETLKALDDSILAHKNDPYFAFNIGFTNCTGWTDGRLADAGLAPWWAPYLGPLETPYTSD